MFHYRVKFEEDDNGTLLVTCPDFPEVTTFAESEEEVSLRAADAIEEAIAARIADREDVPLGLGGGRKSRRSRIVTVSPLISMKLALYDAMRQSNITKASLARALGWHGPQVDRVLDIRHASQIDQMEAAMAAVGIGMQIEFIKLKPTHSKSG